MADNQSRSAPEIVRDLGAPVTARNSHLYKILRRLTDDGTLTCMGGRYRKAGAGDAAKRETGAPPRQPAGVNVTSEVMGDPPRHRSALAEKAAAAVLDGQGSF